MNKKIFKRFKPFTSIKKWFNRKKTKEVINIYRDEKWRPRRDVYLLTEIKPPPLLPWQKMMEEIDFKDGKFSKRKKWQWWRRKRKPKVYDEGKLISAEWGGIRDDSNVIDVEAVEISCVEDVEDNESQPKPMRLLDDPDRDKRLLDDPDRDKRLLDDPDRDKSSD